MIRKLIVCLTGLKLIYFLLINSNLFIIKSTDAKLLKTIYKNGGHDVLLVAKCEAKCWRDENKRCIKDCLLNQPTKKPGICPQNIFTSHHHHHHYNYHHQKQQQQQQQQPSSLLLLIEKKECLQDCNADSQCAMLEKCCQYGCGMICQYPENLSFITNVPEIPYDLKIIEKRKRTIQIKWSIVNNSSSAADAASSAAVILYLLEERHHIGKHFNELMLSKWTPVLRTDDRTNCILKRFIKPGIWYQFRLFAVNENGTKGSSNYTEPFSVNVIPQPPKPPLNLTVGPIFRLPNGSMYVELRWQEPESDLPIEKYKVFWSIQLHEINCIDSVLVRHQIISKNQRSFLIQNLTENLPYFLQVQAISHYGKQRLKSEKSNLLLNTSKYINVTDLPIQPSAATTSSLTVAIEDLKLEKLLWMKNDLKARISWKHHKGALGYIVNWWQIKRCDNNGNFTRSGFTILPQFDLDNIKFSCRYKVTVREVNSDGKRTRQNTSITFETSTCKRLKGAFKKIKCIDK